MDRDRGKVRYPKRQAQTRAQAGEGTGRTDTNTGTKKLEGAQRTTLALALPPAVELELALADHPGMESLVPLALLLVPVRAVERSTTRRLPRTRIRTGGRRRRTKIV